MSYDPHGRRDGRHRALTILATEQAMRAALLRESQALRINATRKIRDQTLKVAQQRILTALTRLTPLYESFVEAELVSALDGIVL